MVKLIELETQQFPAKNQTDLSLVHKSLSEIQAKTEPFDFLLVDLSNSNLDKSSLLDWTPTRKILYIHGSDEDRLFFNQLGHFDLSQQFQQLSAEDFLDFIAKAFFQGQKAGEINPSEFALIPSSFPAFLERNGRYEMIFHGNFGDKFTEALYWSNHIERYWGKSFALPISGLEAGITYEFYADIEVAGNAQYELIFSFFGADESFQERKFTTNEFTLVVPETTFKDALQLSLHLKGEGTVRLGKINFRKSRYGFGTFLPGDSRKLLANGEEILSHFVPGKDNRYLVVSFTGYLNQLPKYEYLSLTRFDFPCLFFQDARTRGGVFQLGKQLNKEYVEAIEARIQEVLDKLGLKRENLIVNGYSMGSFPSLYYGAKFGAGHIIASKPLISLGTMSADKDLIWSMDGWFLSARHYLMEGARKEDTPILDNLLIERLKESDLSKSKFHLFTMNQDEYDGRSLPMLLELINKSGAKLQHVASDGKHADKIPEMQGFIINVLRILKEENHES